jgi:hypothetical protein
MKTTVKSKTGTGFISAIYPASSSLQDLHDAFLPTEAENDELRRRGDGDPHLADYLSFRDRGGRVHAGVAPDIEGVAGLGTA